MKNTASKAPALQAQAGKSAFEPPKANAPVELNPSASASTSKTGVAGATASVGTQSAKAGTTPTTGTVTAAGSNPLSQVAGAVAGFATNAQTLDAQLKSGNLPGAVDTALNSPGDSITLSIGADGSIGAGGNVGVNGGAEVTVTLNDEGKYEVTLTGDAGVTVGAEVAEGTEANAGLSGSITPTFTFDSPEQVAQGLAAMGGLAAGAAPGTSLLTNVVDQVAGPAAGVSNWLGDQFQNASGLPVVGDAANAVGNFFHGIGQGAQAVDNATGVEAAQFLQEHLTSLEVTGGAAVDVAANLGIPGLELEGFGLDAGLAAKGEMSLTLEFGQPPSVSVDRSFELEASASAGLGLGVSGEGTASLNFHNEYTFNENFNLGQALSGQKVESPLTPGEATVTFEMEVQGQGGVTVPGISANTGLGGKVSFEVNQADVTNGLGTAALQSFADGNLSPLLNHLGNVPITVESELYGTMSLEGGVGGSIAGNGVSVEGEVSWQDTLLTDEATFTGNQLLQSAQGGVLTAAQLLEKYGPAVVG
ncbi:MAG: hypothetical protein JXB05_03790 [Myxococcaceae bacterium]|nr:hypothetical protein [Myxococcaceae bacterium]